MAARKKLPQGPIDQVIAAIRSFVSDPVTDQSSLPPTAATVKSVKTALRTPKRKKASSKKKSARTKRSKKA